MHAQLHSFRSDNWDLRIHPPRHRDRLFVEAAIFVILHYPDHRYLVFAIVGSDLVSQRILVREQEKTQSHLILSNLTPIKTKKIDFKLISI